MKQRVVLGSFYSHKEVESKWQAYWIRNNTFYTDLENFKKPKKYILPMFPYPSGNGLHVGHVRNYTITDAMARFYRMMGFNVLLVTGWDAFGLPSEQYAIQTNNHPAGFTQQNIQKFKKQLMRLGFSYDWSKEINTSEENYYHWTQWIFKQIYLEELAQYKNIPVFWCEQLATVLSNEEIKTIDGNRFSERGSFPVVKKNVPQWVLAITKYAHRLVAGLSELDWPSSIKNLQRNWIGIAVGTNIKFPVVGHENLFIEVFTTRADTIYGVNSVALNCSDERVATLTTAEFSANMKEFCARWGSNDSGFSKLNEELAGQFTGSYCLNPINDALIPIWVTNFVFADYGTGALMIAPFPSFVLTQCTNDEFLSRKEIEQNSKIDSRFAMQYQLPVFNFVTINEDQQTVSYPQSSLLTTVHTKQAAIIEVSNYLELRNLGSKSFSYHLKDWVFSRQRYWGEPIPVLHLDNGRQVLVDDQELPLRLPHLTNFQPSPLYYSPLQKAKEWVNIEVNGVAATRDVNVMPQWAGSCWYYIAFLLRIGAGQENFQYLALNSEKARKIINHWLPVDLYVGGQEHANLHLLYARFWHKVLQKKGVLTTNEPFQKLFCQGMILSEDGEKMSKSKGNVVNPDYCVEKWGSDALRLYEVFIGPPDQAVSFDVNGVAAMRKWINRVYALFTTHSTKFVRTSSVHNDALATYFQNTIFEITNCYQELKLNLIVAKLMEFINRCYLSEQVPFHYGQAFLQMLNPLAPHLSEELWSIYTEGSITTSCWPQFQKPDCELVNIVVQVNGKKKDLISNLQPDCEQAEVLRIIERKSKISSILQFGKIKRIIFVKNRLINVVTE